MFRSAKSVRLGWIAGLLAFGLAWIWPSSSLAMTIDVDRNDLGPFGQSVRIQLSGEIEPGDAARLTTELASLDFTPGSALHVVFDSPGGSLIEGMSIGRLIAKVPTTVTTDVGDADLGLGTCASACVLAYLGGHYRYLREGSRLGVHQFYPGEDSEMGGAEGVAIGQVLSAGIVDYLTEMRADPGFFTLMTEAGPEDIRWVSMADLERYRVVTGPVYDEQAEYRNADGIYYLTLWQQSYYGENKIIMACDETGNPVFMSYLQPPDLAFVEVVPHNLTVLIDGVEEEPAQWSYLGGDPRWARAGFALSPDQLARLSRARTFGARMMPPGGDLFFGFEFTIADSKVHDTVVGCRPDRAGPSMGAAAPGALMTVLPGRDFLGGDITPDGIRGVSFEECQAICLDEPTCVAVTWVERNAWCWPKSQLGQYRTTAGLMSALRN